MTRTIHQSVRLPATPGDLFDSYLDPRRHAAITGDKASIPAREGGKFTAFDGMLRGRNLLIVPGCLVVQAWRSAQWKDDERLSPRYAKLNNSGVSPASGGGRIELTHVNAPRHEHRGVTDGWKKCCWKPWREYLRRPA